MNNYNNFTEKDIEEILNKIKPSIDKQRNFNIYMSEEAGKMFHKSMTDIVNSWTKELYITFKSESGKEYNLSFEQYNKLKQETKDKLEPYRVIKNNLDLKINGSIQNS